MLPRERVKSRPITVKEVKKVINVFSREQTEAAQQIIGFFGVSPKLERILWASMHKERLRSKHQAETMTYGGTYNEEDPTHRLIREERSAAKAQRNRHRYRDAPKPQEVIVEPPKPGQVVGVCKCGRNLVGMPIPNCSKQKVQAVFYKECTGCGYFCETIRSKTRNKTRHYEEEGG